MSTSLGSRPRWVLVAVVSAITVLLVAVAAAVLAGSDDGGDDGDRAERSTPAEATPDAAGEATAAPADPAAAARDLVADTLAWHVANPRTPPGTPASVPLDPNVDRDCPQIRIVPLPQDLPQGYVSITYGADPNGLKAFLPVGTSGIHRCPQLKKWVDDHAGQAATVEVGPHTALLCGSVGGGSYDVATTPEVPWSSADWFQTHGEEFLNRPNRCLQNPVANRPYNPSPEWKVMGVTDALQREGRCIGCDFSGLDLRGVRWNAPKPFVSRSNFDGARLEDLAMDDVLLADVSMRGATLRHVRFTDPDHSSNGIMVDLRPAEDGTPTVLDDVILPNEMHGAILDGAILRDVAFPDFEYCVTVRHTALLAGLGVTLDDTRGFNDVPLQERAGEIDCSEPFRGAAVSMVNLRAYGEYAADLKQELPLGTPEEAADTLAEVRRLLLPMLGGGFLYVDPTDVGKLKDLMLYGLDLRNVQVIGASADLSGIDLGRTLLAGSNFDRQDFGSKASFVGADLTGTSFVGARLVGADFSDARIEKANFRGADVSGARFSSSVDPTADKTKITDEATTQGPDFTGARALETVFTQAHGLAAADFTGAVLRNAKFDGATLTKANFDHADASQANFAEAWLRASNFKDALCVNCIFTNAHLGKITVVQNGGASRDEYTSFAGAQMYGVQMSVDDALDSANLDGMVTDGLPKANWIDPTTPYEGTSSYAPLPTILPSGSKTSSVTTCPSGAPAVHDGQTGCTLRWTVSQPPALPTCRRSVSFACAPAVEPYWLYTDGPRPVAVAHQADTDVWLVARDDGSVEVRQGKKAVTAKTVTGGRPTALVADIDGSFYLADAATVSRITLDTKTLAPSAVRVAGNGGGGDFGDGRPATDAGFTAIAGLAVDPAGQLLIADATAGRIRVLAGDGTVRPLEVQGAEKLGSPGAMAFDRQGRLYVVVPTEHKVKQLTFVPPTAGSGAPAAVTVGPFAGTGKAGYDATIGSTFEGAPFGLTITAKGAAFDRPSGVAIADLTTASTAVNGLPLTVLVADRGNAALRPINSSNSRNPHAVMRPWAGLPGAVPRQPNQTTTTLAEGEDSPYHGLGEALYSVDSVAVSPDQREIMVVDAQSGIVHRVTFPNAAPR